MKILNVGDGPAGLYLACLLERREARQDIRIVEQNPSDATFGFGVVFSDRALDFLRNDNALTQAQELRGHDPVVAADGANSFVRRQFEPAFGTHIELLNKHFVADYRAHRGKP